MFLLTNWEDAAVRKYSERRPSSKWIVIRPTSPLTNVYSYSRTPPLDITNLYLTQGWIRGYSVTAYPRIHLVNIFKIIVAGYPRMRVSTSIYKAYKAYRISMCLKATEGRKAHKRDNCVYTYPALSGIQLRSGRVFCSYSKRFSLPQ